MLDIKGLSNKKIIMAGVALVVLLVLIIGFVLLFKKEETVREAKNTPEVQPFKEVNIDYSHVASEQSYPFLGGAAIDVDGDGTMEIFISGSQDQSSGLFRFTDGEMMDITSDSGLDPIEATYGAVSIDIENDGDTDLLLAQSSGVWLYINNGGHFTVQKLILNLPEHSIPMAIALTDLNNDGLVDLYISNFIAPSQFQVATFNNPEHAKPNLLLVNTGDGEFEDITRQTGTAGVQNSFHAAFIDIDNNGYQDIVVANNTGPVEIFKHYGNYEFEPVVVDSGLGYWMGLGAGDIDRDGDQDLFFSNIGSSIPEKFVRGDLNDDQALNLDWLLLENAGQGGFRNATRKYGLEGYGFGWGGVFEDMNLDGELDLLVAQNYIKWPKHKANKLPNKAFIQLKQAGRRGFYHLDELGLNNPHYGHSPLIADLNNDGLPDVVWLNMDGPARAFLNQSIHNYLKVLVPDTARYLGATLSIETKAGRSYTKQVMANIGFATDQTPNVFFGLGEMKEITSLNVRLANGEESIIENPQVNSTVILE